MGKNYPNYSKLVLRRIAKDYAASMLVLTEADYLDGYADLLSEDEFAYFVDYVQKIGETMLHRNGFNEPSPTGSDSIKRFSRKT